MMYTPASTEVFLCLFFRLKELKGQRNDFPLVNIFICYAWCSYTGLKSSIMQIFEYNASFDITVILYLPASFKHTYAD